MVEKQMVNEKEVTVEGQKVTTGRITLPDAPAIPGLVYRQFRGESDYPEMLAVIHGSKDIDGIERSETLEDIARNYAHLHNSDPYEDMLFAEIDGQVISYSRVEWYLNDQGEWLGFHLNFLLPPWRRKGIGRAMLRYNERRLQEIAAQLRREGKINDENPCFFETYAYATETGKEILFQREGYTPVRYGYSMVRDLREDIEVTSMPEGLEVRPVPPEQYRTVWEADQEAFRDHWNFAPSPENAYQNWLASPEFNPDIWKVAWDGDQIAGMVLNFVNEAENAEYNRNRGYTEGISVRRPWRRRGLARALLTRSLKMFKDMGMDEAALDVDTQNLSGALRLYESVGFIPVKRTTTYRKRLIIR